MKHFKPILFAAAMAGVWLLCSSDIAPGNRYDGYAPYFMERAELERSVSYSDEPREMENPGKIWVSGDGGTIYIVERYRGVHVIDNSDSANPVNTKFIVAPGCMDVAVKDNIIYLDNAVDLVAFDMATGVVTKRIKEYFPEPASPTGERFYNDSGMILAGWKKSTTNK